MEIKFICKNCGRNLSAGEDFSYAAFLYGVFFLEGQNDGIIGTTCPSCLKTAAVLVNKSRFEETASIRNSFNFRGQEYSSCFKYFPTVTAYDMFDKPEYSSLILGGCLAHFSNQEDIHNCLEEFQGVNPVTGYNSYGSESLPVVGGYFYNIWADYDQVLKLLEIERKFNIRTFPRYVFNNNLLEKTEDLFQVYHYNKRLHGKLTEAFSHTLLSIGTLNENLKEAEFHDTLTTEPIPELYRKLNSIPTQLWQTTHPFKGEDNSELYEHRVNNSCETEKDYSQIYQLVKDNYNKEYSLQFLGKSIDSFLNDYATNERFGIMRANWSHADLWHLKNRYLSEYHWIVKKGLRKEQKYFFYREGKGFRFKFNNRHIISGLDGIGFHYIHYLICHPNETIRKIAIYNIFNNSSAYSFDKSIHSELAIKDGHEDYFQLGDDKTRADLLEEIANKKEELLKASSQGHKDRELKLRLYIEKLERHFDEYFLRKTRKPKVKRSKSLKNAADTVGIAIKRALDDLANKFGYSDAAKYFNDSIPRQYGDSLKFSSSDHNIEWHT